MKKYASIQEEAYKLIEQARARSPETLKLAKEAAERQARMTDADRNKGLTRIVKDTALAND